MKRAPRIRWALLWRSENRMDGKRRYLIGSSEPAGVLLFNSRAAARRYLQNGYEWMREREDLRREPYGWKMPQVVKVRVEVTCI